MKLLIITQKIDINDDVLGFMHGWVNEFAKHCERVTVIALGVGRYDLPANVEVLSLGKKENFKFKILNLKLLNKIKYLINFFKFIWRERNNYDAIFVHMNKEYVILGGVLWRMLGKKVGLWYAHGYVPFSLKIAEKLSNIIFTSTQGGFRLKSKKIKVIGQGIDVSKFNMSDFRFKNDSIFKIITIGRISPVKDYETLIKAVEELNRENIKAQVEIIGGAGLPEQEEYLFNLRRIVDEKNLKNINFVGAVPNKDIVSYLKSADLFVNTSHTGSLDKAILEAMASGLPILTCNEALADVLGEYKSKLIYPKNNYRELANKIKFIINLDLEAKEKIRRDLREIVIHDHNISRLIEKILEKYEEKN